MAVHRESVPPRTLEDWRIWEDACIQTNNRQWLPGDSIRIDWPEGFVPDVAPGWIPLAEDHPFKGRIFCWRCLAEAAGFPASDAPHKRDAVCWGPADGDADAEDADPDTGEALPFWADFDIPDADEAVRRIREFFADPEAVRDYARNAYVIAEVADEQPEPSPPIRRGYDTGTFFYDGPTAEDH